MQIADRYASWVAANRMEIYLFVKIQFLPASPL